MAAEAGHNEAAPWATLVKLDETGWGMGWGPKNPGFVMVLTCFHFKTLLMNWVL